MDTKREATKTSVDKYALQRESREAENTAKQLKLTVEQLTKNTITMMDAIKDSKLTQWETDFLTTLEERFYSQQRPLTRGQYEHLEKIYRKDY